MLKYCLTYYIMQKNTVIITVIYFLLCLTFNYTFPLQRETGKWSLTGYHPNGSVQCNALRNPDNHENKRNKKMVFNIENTLKKIKDSTQDFGKNIYDHINAGFKGPVDKNTLSEEDLRQYEQLVIMKKYPYLDFKELELKYNPGKHPRQSIKFEPDTMFGNDPGLCESLDDGPNVEVSNRGLSGFAMPPQLAKHSGLTENKARSENMEKIRDDVENPLTQLFSKKPIKEKSLESHNNDLIY